jgi:cation diffusion facilitator family transporter
MSFSNPNTIIKATAGIRSTSAGIALNFMLALIKGLAGVIGNSNALIADAIESIADSLSSLVIIFGLKMASRPADKNHPYGHGKFEPLASASVALLMLIAAILIAVSSIHQILNPNLAPAPFTLAVLLVVMLFKEAAYRRVQNVANEIGSSAIEVDAWHHRADAFTSLAAFIGISITLLGGPGYESAEDFAALIAAGIISINAIMLLKPALLELIDTAPAAELSERIRLVAEQVPGVLGTHKCNIRKLGFDYFVDLDVLCNPDMSIREGHDIAHLTGAALHREFPQIAKVLVHVEPADDYGRR